MEQQDGAMMRKIGIAMAVRMGILMSFFLALIGTLLSGHFTVPGFLISFLLSSVVSILIGLLIPIKKLSGGLLAKLRIRPDTLKARVAESLLSDLLYTPLLTFLMVGFSYMAAMKASGGKAGLVFWPMYGKSLAVCFAAGFVLIFLFTPLFLNQLLRKTEK